VTRRLSPVTFALLVALAAAGFCYSQLAQTTYQFDADAPYHILSTKSLATGHGLQSTNEAHLKYPPGWSVLLLPVEWLSGGTFSAYATYSVLFLPLALLMAWCFYRVRGQPHGNWLTLALLLSIPMFEFGTRGVRSELSFTFFCLGFLAWHEQRVREPDKRFHAASILLGTVLLLGCVAIRSVGLAMFVAVLCTGAHLLWRGRRDYWRIAIVPLSVSAAYLLAWRSFTGTRRVALYPGELNELYDKQFWMRDPHHPDLGAASVADVLMRIPTNIRIQAVHCAEVLTNIAWISVTWTSPLVVIATVLLLLGLVNEFRRPSPLVGYFVVVYMGILSVWPFDEGWRFVTPLVPILGMFAYSGYRTLRAAVSAHPTIARRVLGALALLELPALAYRYSQHSGSFGRQEIVALMLWSVVLLFCAVGEANFAKPPLRRALPLLRLAPLPLVALYVVLGIAGVAKAARFNVRNSRSDRTSAAYEAARWLQANAPPSSVVMAKAYLELRLVLQRKTVPFPITSDSTVMQKALDVLHPSFLVVQELGDDYHFPTELDRLALLNRSVAPHPVLRAALHGIEIYEFPWPTNGALR
jgi:hypothetical protein